MRSHTGFLFAAALLAGSAAVPSAPAEARARDHVYADSFGNLVIESAAGYKRILVGEGRFARELADYVDAGQTEVDTYRETSGSVERDCYRPPVFVKGRSYMYGLSDGEMPELSPCR
jgi:hypothetical protein